ncbi:MAG: HAMP domain-containing histidine kinase [Sulfurospirillum sp.]|nr:HAMP domain-containing histidine kinase [Sulfurospirillum sp.]
MSNEEKKSLFAFLAFYTLSAAILIGVIAYMYYKKELVAIEDKCSIQMSNAALMVEKELMNAQLEESEYVFASPSPNLHIGLFGTDGSKIHSNLENDTVLLSKRAYKNNTHEFHIDTLGIPIFGVKYIVVEGQEGKKSRINLLTLISIIAAFSLCFVGFVGYVLSQILLEPIRSRMHQLNNFIKDSSHDLNTPISALMMSVSALKKKKELDMRLINHIAISSKLISQIYNSLAYVAFCDRDIVLDEKFDLRLVVAQSVRFFEDIAAVKGNNIEIDLEPTSVCMDRSRAQKIINNLLSNAIKYSYANTTIRVKLANHILSVTDSGEGIKKEDQALVFDRFTRRSKEQGGFGVGLDIVQSVCREYGIKIKLESSVGVGSTFNLTFAKVD